MDDGRENTATSQWPRESPLGPFSTDHSDEQAGPLPTSPRLRIPAWVVGLLLAAAGCFGGWLLGLVLVMIPNSTLADRSILAAALLMLGVSIVLLAKRKLLGIAFLTASATCGALLALVTAVGFATRNF